MSRCILEIVKFRRCILFEPDPEMTNSLFEASPLFSSNPSSASRCPGMFSRRIRKCENPRPFLLHSSFRTLPLLRNVREKHSKTAWKLENILKPYLLFFLHGSKFWSLNVRTASDWHTAKLHHAVCSRATSCPTARARHFDLQTETLQKAIFMSLLPEFDVSNQGMPSSCNYVPSVSRTERIWIKAFWVYFKFSPGLFRAGSGNEKIPLCAFSILLFKPFLCVAMSGNY